MEEIYNYHTISPALISSCMREGKPITGGCGQMDGVMLVTSGDDMAIDSDSIDCNTNRVMVMGGLKDTASTVGSDLMELIGDFTYTGNCDHCGGNDTKRDIASEIVQMSVHDMAKYIDDIDMIFEQNGDYSAQNENSSDSTIMEYLID